MKNDMHSEHGSGLAHDLETLSLSVRVSRRRMLSFFAGAGLVSLAGCGGGSEASGGSGTGGTEDDARSGTGAQVAARAAGPRPRPASSGTCTVIPRRRRVHPGDGSNGGNALATTGIVRRNIRSSFGATSGTAEGVPLTIELTV
jgi:hypothetical protein